jgi:ABC-type branched-subunit amino acid transport system ATPase component
MQRYARDSGCGVLLVEQHIQLALEVADRGYVLSHGEIVLHDRAQVLNSDRELVVSSYLGEQQVPIGESAESSENRTSTMRKETA